MIAAQKCRVELEDYDYQKDITNRLLLRNLSAFQLEVLQELTCNSLKLPLSELCDIFSLEKEELLSTLNVLSPTGLFSVQNDKVLVDKERRKYYEKQLEKFEPGFAPGIEYVRSMLTSLPIHILPNWYSIPKSTDDIIQSIIDKHLRTPKIYQRYLEEIAFDSPVHKGIVQDMHQSPNLQVNAKELMERYNLDRLQFEEIMLQLEFYCACFLTYDFQDGECIEYVTCLAEYRDYLNSLKANIPLSFDPVELIVKRSQREFGFIEDLNSLLTLAENGPIRLEKEPSGEYKIAADTVEDLFTHSLQTSYSSIHCKELLETIRLLGLGEITKGNFTITEQGRNWKVLSLQQQATNLYLFVLNHYRLESVKAKGYSDKDIREIEKQLRRFLYLGWLPLNELVDALFAPVGAHEEIHLKKVGKKWMYTVPTYLEKDREFVCKVLTHYFYQSGFCQIGHLEGKQYITITAFGRMTLAE